MKIIKQSVLAFSIALAIVGCKKDEVSIVEENSGSAGSTTGAIAELFPDAEETQTFTIAAVDAKTGLPIGVTGDGESARIKITGTDAGSVRQAGGSSISELFTEYGLASISADKIGTENDPFDINAVVTADGYVPTSKRITSIDSTSGIITITMVKVGDEPNGVSSKIDNSVAITGGVTNTDVSFSSSVVSTTNTKATAKVPAGVEMKDANGNVLSGAIKSTMVYFNGTDDDAILASPGGTVSVPANINGEKLDINRSPVGGVSLEMTDANGTKVKTFSKPVDVVVEIPADTKKDDGTLLQAGDSLDVFSYDTETGEFTLEGATVVETITGKLSATMKVTHLSGWGLDIRRPYKTGCSGRWGRLNVTLDGKLYKDAPHDVSIYNKKTGKLIQKTTVLTQFQGITNLSFFGRYTDRVLQIKPSEPLGCPGKFKGDGIEIDACVSNRGMSYPLTTNPNYVKPIIVTGDITGTCKAKPNVKIRPTAPVFYFKISGGQDCGTKFGHVQMKEGKISAEVEAGATYMVWFSSGGKAYGTITTIDANKTHYVINQDFVGHSACQ